MHSDRIRGRHFYISNEFCVTLEIENWELFLYITKKNFLKNQKYCLYYKVVPTKTEFNDV